MKILKSDRLAPKLLVENLDDLWYLNSIIDQGDIVESRSFRKIKLGESGDRNQKIIKKPVYLKLSVEKVEFHPSSSVLRVSGKITEGTDDVPAGSYHTFNVAEQTSLTIAKTEWLKYQKAKLEEATKEKKSDVLVMVLDRDEAHIALLKKYGYELLTSIEGNVQKKADTDQKAGDFFGDVSKILKEYIERYKIRKVIVASPAFWKEEFVKQADEGLKKMIVQATSSSGDAGAINEVLKRDEVKSVLSEARVAEEMKLVEKVLSNISKDGPVAYGVDETETSVNAGAAATLLVTDGLIRRLREDDNFDRVNTIMKNADRTQAEVHIISSDHDGGKKLDGLGGIAAILRYKTNY